MKFEPQVVISNSNKSTKWHECDWCSELSVTIVCCLEVLATWKMHENGIAVSVGKDQDPYMKFQPQVVLSNSNKSTKWHECDWCSELYVTLVCLSEVLATW